MLGPGIIEPSSSEWASPIVWLTKRTALYNSVDYQQLNAESQMDAYPMPRIDRLVGQSQIHNYVDLTRGYWQVPIAKSYRHYTAFTTPFGIFDAHWPPRSTRG